jgi:hypothetical protein
MLLQSTIEREKRSNDSPLARDKGRQALGWVVA